MWTSVLFKPCCLPPGSSPSYSRRRSSCIVTIIVTVPYTRHKELNVFSIYTMSLCCCKGFFVEQKHSVYKYKYIYIYIIIYRIIVYLREERRKKKTAHSISSLIAVGSRAPRCPKMSTPSNGGACARFKRSPRKAKSPGRSKDLQQV